MSPLEPLRILVESLRVDLGGTVSLDGNVVARSRGAAQADLAEALAAVIYEHAYTRPYPREPVDDGPERDLGAALAAANRTRARSELGWTLVELGRDGSAIASRHGRLRRFAPGQYVAVDGEPAAGAALAVQTPAGSATRQPGFHYVFGEGFREANDLSPIVRLYWNVSAAGAPALVALLTGALNRYRIPFEMKVTTRSADFARRDNGVLYLGQDDVAVAGLIVAGLAPALAPLLRPGVPLFTKPWGEGIGLAEDPGAGESFGSARSKLVAAALARARDGDHFDFAAFGDAFAGEVAAAGLRLDALWLNPGSGEIYPFPLSSNQTKAA